MSNGKIGDTCAKLPQTHMYMESDVIQYQLEKSSCSLLNRIFNDEMNDL
jgi:hypothetical protein